LPGDAPAAEDTRVELRDTRYAKTPDGAYIAYQTFGEGRIDLVWQFDFFGNVDVMWELPRWDTFFRALAGFSRVILHDRRGTGLSSRNVPAPNLETRVADLLTVLETVHSERPVLAGSFQGGAPNMLLAATHPERAHSLVWDHPQARSQWAEDYPWGVGPEFAEAERRSLEHWGTSGYAKAWAATTAAEGHDVSSDEQLARHIAKLSRHSATPDVARELSQIHYETDVRGILGSVRAPSLLMTEPDPAYIEEATYVASLLPDARVEVHDLAAGPAQAAELIRRFTGAKPSVVSMDTVLATVLFTDIVGSTEKQSSLGDRGWKDLVGRHHAIVRESLARWHGVENDTAGDGFYATFDGPARAIRCALEITEHVRDLGIEIRAGIHTGECEVIEGKCAGIAVSIGGRVASNAGPSEVLVSQTVKDLVAGSGLTFEDRGEYELKGVPERSRLLRVVGQTP
jgi:class 3 adenylate cyclase